MPRVERLGPERPFFKMASILASMLDKSNTEIVNWEQEFY